MVLHSTPVVAIGALRLRSTRALEPPGLESCAGAGGRHQPARAVWTMNSDRPDPIVALDGMLGMFGYFLRLRECVDD